MIRTNMFLMASSAILKPHLKRRKNLHHVDRLHSVSARANKPLGVLISAGFSELLSL